MLERGPDDTGILVNGRREPMPSTGDLAGLLASRGLTPDSRGVAAAVNDVVVPRHRWRGHALRAGDRVEIVGAVQGG